MATGQILKNNQFYGENPAAVSSAKQDKLARVAAQNSANIPAPAVSSAPVKSVTTPSAPISATKGSPVVSDQSFVGGGELKRQEPKVTQPVTMPTQTQEPVQPMQQTQPVQTNLQRYEEQLGGAKQGLMDAQTNQGLAGAVKTVQQNQEEKAYQESQKKLKDEAQQYASSSASIQSSQRISDAQKQLTNLKQNLAYLGSGGRPGKSAVQLEAVGKQQADAQNTFNQIVELENNRKEMERIGAKFDSASYARQMKGLQDDLDNKVSRVVQDAITSFSAEAADIDTMEELNQVREKYLDSVDTSLEGITQRQVQQRQMLNDEYTNLVKDTKDQIKVRQEQDALYEKNRNVVNTELSTARGYYVDGNGEPVIGANGQPIPHRRESIYSQVDPSTGNLVEVTIGPDGEYVTTMTPVLDVPKANQGVVGDIKDAIARGTMTVEQALDLYPSLRNQPDLLGQIIRSAPTPVEETKDTEWKLNSSTGEYYKTAPDGSLQTAKTPQEVTDTGSLTGKAVSNTILSGNVDVLASTMKEGEAYECGSRSQCGERFNDAMGIKNGTRVGSKYSEKTQYIDPSITQGKPGDGVVFNPGGEFSTYGHVGVLASGPEVVNGVPGYYVMSANYSTPDKLSKDFVPETLIANSGGGFIPKKVREEPKQKAFTEDMDMQVMGLVQGLGGTEGERKQFAENIVKTAEKNNISLQEAKKKLGYKSGDDVEFAKNRKEQFTAIQKSNQAITKGKSALSLLDQPQTAVGDVASIVGFLKTIDPASVARESEVDSVENARGLLDNIAVKYEKMSTGKKLSEEQRQELRDTIGVIVKEYEANMSDFIQSSKQEFEDRGLDMTVYVPKDVISKYSQKDLGLDGGMSSEDPIVDEIVANIK